MMMVSRWEGNRKQMGLHLMRVVLAAAAAAAAVLPVTAAAAILLDLEGQALKTRWTLPLGAQQN